MALYRTHSPTPARLFSLTFCCRHPLLAARSASLLFLRSLFGVALELRCHFCARFALYYSSIYFAYCIAVCFILCSLYFVYFFCTPFVVAFVPQVSDSGDFCFNIFPIAADCQTEESDKKKEMSAVAPCTHTHTYSDSCVCALLLLFNSFLLIGSTYNEIDNTHLHATLSGVCQLTQLQICSTCPAQSPRLTICCQLTHTHRNTHTQQCKLLGKHKRLQSVAFRYLSHLTADGRSPLPLSLTARSLALGQCQPQRQHVTFVQSSKLTSFTNHFDERRLMPTWME